MTARDRKQLDATLTRIFRGHPRVSFVVVRRDRVRLNLRDAFQEPIEVSVAAARELADHYEPRLFPVGGAA